MFPELKDLPEQRDGCHDALVDDRGRDRSNSRGSVDVTGASPYRRRKRIGRVHRYRSAGEDAADRRTATTVT
jgi:hypothetical protein